MMYARGEKVREIAERRAFRIYEIFANNFLLRARATLFLGRR
jgi:hypothetical protein